MLQKKKKKNVLEQETHKNTEATQWVMYPEIPPFGEDTKLTSINGMSALRWFAFGGWKHLLKGSQRLNPSPALLSELTWI